MASRDTLLPVPQQPDPAVEETSFEADIPHRVDSDCLTTPQLEHQPEPYVGQRSQAASNGYGSIGLDNATAPVTQPQSTARALAPDLLRGLLMALMALDHSTLALQPWGHGTGVNNEGDSIVVREWNRPLGYVIRTLTHLCAPGFVFLLGLGVVYFGRSRSNLGWSNRRMAWHFFVRCVVLTVVSEVVGLPMLQYGIWFINVVLFAMAIDYLIVGLLWLASSGTEKAEARLLLRLLPDAKEDDPTEPLLQRRDGVEGIAPDRKIIRASDISWHMHNALLLVLVMVTIWWNVWLSPTGGYCAPDSDDKMVNQGITDSNWFRIWFYFVHTDHIMSAFPPLAWVSFAIMGLLYGRVILARSWKTSQIIVGNAAAGLVCVLLFALTRILRVGNLSENCLRTPEHAEHPDMNPYLVSGASFFYITKYPPDVAFWAYAMAGTFFLLAMFSAVPVDFANRWGKPLLAYGRSPLYFYVSHFYILFALARILVVYLGKPTGRHDEISGEPIQGVQELWIYFPFWLFILAFMYPCCQAYEKFKRSKGADSIWRFF